jgi:hypothetical protein
VELPLDPLGRAETDLVHIRNIEGLGPVNAAINTTPLGSLDGNIFVGSSVASRNIVLTLAPNPDWSTWTYEKLRQLIYTYFMPKKMVRLVFETDEFSPVEIFGYIESNEPKIFSKDGEIQVSVICPYPYFTSVDPVVMTGTTYDDAIVVDYEGTVESGVVVEMHYVSGVAQTGALVRIGDELGPSMYVYTTIDATNYYKMSSIPGQKYIQLVNVSTGVITNLLSEVEAGSIWPAFQPGENTVLVTGAGGSPSDWTLTYYNRFGGL